MNATDFEPIIQSIMTGLSLILTGLIAIYVPRGIAAFEKATSIKLTAQQQATVMQSAMTAKGILETKLDQGLLSIEHITPENPTVRSEAVSALGRVPEAAQALGKSPYSMAQTIVGLVDTTTPRGPVEQDPAAFLARAAQTPAASV